MSQLDVPVSLDNLLMQQVTVCPSVKTNNMKTQLNAHVLTLHHLTMKITVLEFANQPALLAKQMTYIHVAVRMDNHLMTLASVFQHAQVLNKKILLNVAANMVKDLILLVSVCQFVIQKPLILIQQSAVVHTVTFLT